MKNQKNLNNKPKNSAENNVTDFHAHEMTPVIVNAGDFALKTGKEIIYFLAFLGETAEALWYAIRHPRKIRWKETLYYMDVCGSDAVPIVCMICLLMGLILGFQSALQMQKYGTGIYVADLVGLSIVKELGPLMVAMICIGRAGSAFAAELGTMKVGEEIDAMTTMGFVPSRFLVVPKILALLAVMPLLTIFGDIMGIAGGFLVGKIKLGIPIIAYYERSLIAIKPQFVVEGLIKSIVFSVLIGVVGCYRGIQAPNDTQGVGRAATSAVVSGIFLVVIADCLITMILSNWW